MNIMETKIKEVQSYFRNKLIAGDFKIDGTDEYVLNITVDGKYKFSIWIGNWNFPDNVRLYDGYYNFMMVDFNQKEIIKLKSIIAPEVDKFRKNVLLKNKRKELEELEKELNSITATE